MNFGAGTLCGGISRNPVKKDLVSKKLIKLFNTVVLALNVAFCPNSPRPPINWWIICCTSWFKLPVWFILIPPKLWVFDVSAAGCDDPVDAAVFGGALWTRCKVFPLTSIKK